MADIAYLKKILEEQYGIQSAADLHAAIQKMNLVDLGVFRSEPTTKRKEYLQCAC